MKYHMENNKLKVHSEWIPLGKVIKLVKSLLTFFVGFLAISSSLLALSSKANAASMEGIPKRPTPFMQVNNFSRYQLLSKEQSDALETKLDAFTNATSNQIVIVFVDSLYDHDMAEFATQLGQEWQVGQKKFDNGLVILINPGAHQVFIAPGYGLEGAIPDATCEDIVQREIKPNFKKGDYYKGLNDALDVIIGLAKGEYNSSEYARKNGQSGKALGLIFALIFFLVFFLFSRRNGGKGGMTIGGPGIFFWGGGFGGGGSSFGGGGGGFGGGGFGGGGGGFGGGGAGGSW
ncbi:MAG TPA: TPM domain-containing protein [Bacteroidia bacterium]|jgi:uncharacterized protein|nr:TPM domain-containing protein [Bacteroidia bacterium]